MITMTINATVVAMPRTHPIHESLLANSVFHMSPNNPTDAASCNDESVADSPAGATTGCSSVGGRASPPAVWGPESSISVGDGRLASRSPRSTPSASARAGITVIAGATSSRSHRLTEDDDRPMDAASWPRDMPFFSRDSRMKRPRDAESSICVMVSAFSISARTSVG